jgi:hypothetical protein
MVKINLNFSMNIRSREDTKTFSPCLLRYPFLRTLNEMHFNGAVEFLLVQITKKTVTQNYILVTFHNAIKSLKNHKFTVNIEIGSSLCAPL